VNRLPRRLTLGLAAAPLALLGIFYLWPFLTLVAHAVNADVELPPEFVEAAVIPADPHTVDPAEIDANRSTWIDEWTELVIG